MVILPIGVLAGVTDEKASAVHALGSYAQHCGAAFVPYYEAALKAFGACASYFHEGVRENAYTALGHLCTAAHTNQRSQPGLCSGQYETAQILLCLRCADSALWAPAVQSSFVKCDVSRPHRVQGRSLLRMLHSLLGGRPSPRTRTKLPSPPLSQPLQQR